MLHESGGHGRSAAAAAASALALLRSFAKIGNGRMPAILCGDALAHGRAGEQLAVEPGGQRLAPARLAVREMAGEAARVARAQRASAAVRMIALDALAAGAGDDVVVLLGQAPARAEERGLHGRPAHAHPAADLRVAQALELAQDEDLVVGLRQAAERAAQAVELVLGRDGDVRRGAGGDESDVVGGRQALVGVVGDLFGALGTAERVDAGVLGDLVEPGLEGERLLGLAHAAQRGEEDLLRDVLGAPVVLDHPEHVGVDAPVVALVEHLERAIVAAPYRARRASGRRPPGFLHRR